MKRLLIAAVALVAVVGCSGTGTVEEGYRFRPADAAVKVDTPQLRQLKAAAGIEACPTSNPHASPTTGGLPAVTLPCLGGGRDVDLAGLRGRPTVLNFWSQTCGPCRTESPILQRVHQTAGARVQVLGIDWQDPRPAYALGFARELGLTYPQLADPDAATRAPLRITALPVTLFVDASGRIVYRQYGAMQSAGQLRALIKREFGVTVPTVGG
jgi:cytochrome c biogenesis protein CcmG, thiol:disulfide interchange protein DsbE